MRSISGAHGKDAVSAGPRLKIKLFFLIRPKKYMSAPSHQQDTRASTHRQALSARNSILQSNTPGASVTESLPPVRHSSARPHTADSERTGRRCGSVCGESQEPKGGQEQCFLLLPLEDSRGE